MNDGRIVVDPQVMGGVPTIRGTCVTVAAILGYLGAGLSFEALSEHLPSLTTQDVSAALGYAAASLPVERPFAVA